MSTYTPVIGLEIHVELKTKSKMFCQCSVDYFGKEPNTNTCPVCLALPGALPVPNRKALEWCIKIGKAFNCKINLKTKFDRKHYFYPDLPKGYQISQYDEPVAVGGQVELRIKNREPRRFGITRVHMEEDTGKLIHIGDDSLVDFNRSGVPLVEIVTEPDFTSSEEVKEFLQQLHAIIRYLEVSDADMEKGSMRMEPNISLRIKNQESRIKNEPIKLPNYKVEVKNINSFNFVKRAIDFEVARQTELLERGETPTQETRGYDEKTMKTVSQRSKEEAHDYRYFPEPDIPPIVFEQSYIDSIELPELPSKKKERFVKELGLKEADAVILTQDSETAKFFEEVLSKTKTAPQVVANLIVNKKLNANLTVAEFAKKTEELLRPKQTNMADLAKHTESVCKANKDAVENFKAGKEASLMYLVGQVMKEMKGEANPQVVREALLSQISKS